MEYHSLFLKIPNYQFIATILHQYKRHHSHSRGTPETTKFVTPIRLKPPASTWPANTPRSGPLVSSRGIIPQQSSCIISRGHTSTKHRIQLAPCWVYIPTMKVTSMLTPSHNSEHWKGITLIVDNDIPIHLSTTQLSTAILKLIITIISLSSLATQMHDLEQAPRDLKTNKHLRL